MTTEEQKKDMVTPFFIVGGIIILLVLLLSIPVCGVRNPFNAEPGIFKFYHPDLVIEEFDNFSILISKQGEGKEFKFKHKGTYYENNIGAVFDGIMAEELETGKMVYISDHDLEFVTKISDE